MQEQFSSTTDSDLDAMAQPAVLSCATSRQGLSTARRSPFSLQAARIGAVVIGFAALGAAGSRHALAQQDATGSAAPLQLATTASLLPLALIADQLPANQARAVNDFNWIALTRPSGDSPRQNSSDTTITASFKPSDATTHSAIVTVATERRNSAMPYRRIYRMSRAAGLGQTNIARAGQAGLLERTYKVTYRDDVPVAYHYQGRRVIKAPVDMIIDAGYTDRAARAMPSRSGLYTRTSEIDMVATGYSPMEGSGSGRCANGMRAGYGVVAVDPRLIPLGSKLFIEGYGYAFAGDTGGAIKGHRIDLGQNTYHAASMVGRRKVRVYVLNDAYSR